MELSAVQACFLIFILTWILIRFLKTEFVSKKIPGPTGLPLLGCIFSIDPSKMHLTFSKWANKYGQIFQVDFLGYKVIVLNNVALIRKAFASDTYGGYFCNRPPTFAAKHVLGQHKDLALATQYNKKTIMLRKMVNKALQFQSLKIDSLENHVMTEISRLLDVIEGFDEQEFDIKSVFRYSFGNLMSILLSGQKPSDSDSDMLWKYNKNMVMLLETSLNLILDMFPFVKYLPGSTGDQIRETKKVQEQVLKRYFSEGGYEQSSLIHTLFQFQLEQNKKSDTDQISDENVKGVLLDFVVGGMTSTSNFIVAVILVLLHHPEYMEAVQNEIDRTIGRHRPPTLTDKNHMHILMACILETMRYATIGPLGLPHLVKEDIEFEGYHFSKGTVVYGNVWYSHHDKKHWDDPWTFSPARFLDDDGKLLPPSHVARQNVITFSVGKRGCPAGDYSTGRIFLYLASLYQRFHIKPVENGDYIDFDPHHFKPGLFLEPNDFMCKAIRWS